MNIIQYEVELTLTEPLLGSLPANPEILKDWILSKGDDILGTEKEQEELAALPQGALAEKLEEQKTTCFPRTAGGHLFLWNYVLKGNLKASANLLKDSLGIKSARYKLTEQVFVKPRQLILLREGEPLTEPDRILTRPLRADTAQGPRTSLSSSECVDPPVSLCARLDVINTTAKGNAVFTESKLRELLSYGAYRGLGQWSNGGFGTYEHTLVKCE